MQQGDAPYTKYLADHYAMSDNYHQPAMGGTGLDSIMLFFGDAIFFSDENGNPLTPPHNQMTWAGGPVDEVENPDPQPGTNNFWIQDGYGGFGNYGTLRWSLRRRQLCQLRRSYANPASARSATTWLG